MSIKSNIRILIIDDESGVRQSLKMILQSLGFTNISGAVSGKEGLTHISTGIDRNEPVEYIICDYDMPKMSGVEFFEKIKQDDSTKELPFLLISGYSDQTFIIKAIEIGIKNILIKPFSKQSLISEMAKMFN